MRDAIPECRRWKRQAEQTAIKPDLKVARLLNLLATTRRKRGAAKAADAPTKGLEDLVYRMEDDLRLATRAR